MTASFEAKLIVQRTTWDVVRMSWTPMLVAVVLMGGSSLLERASPTAASVIGGLAGMCMMGGVVYMAFAWQRGPMITVADDVLAIGDRRRAPLTELHTRVGEFVMQWRTRYSRGITWAPVLTLCFADRSEVQIGCQGAGGPADGRAPTRQPQYHLPKKQWDELVALLGAPSSA